MVLYTIIFLQFKYRIINYWKYSMIFFIASMCSKFFRIIFTVLIGLSVFDLMQNICCHNFQILRWFNFSGWLVGLVWFGLIWYVNFIYFFKYAVGNELPVFWEWKGRFILSFTSSDIFIMSNHIQWTRYISFIYWIILRSFTLFGLLWFIYWFLKRGP